MALFVKKTEEETEVAMIYTTGFGRTRVFVGLGNPGAEHSGNRHNVGFMVLDRFAASSNLQWTEKKDLKCVLASGDIGGTRTILVKPTTYMNNSGEAVHAVLNFFKLNPEEMVVVYDEVDINFGKLQIKQAGGAAGHNGLKSLLQHNQDSFTRIRVGIGPKTPAQIDLADFVLQNFATDQLEKLKMIINEAASILGEATATNLSPQTISVA
ncbi:aminoacyl-tRNA hydrolase [Candidatus Saccharibacteria bacterium]|nr:aminoacyl-tRNA hydrolase [Candidatus Saccharibacteria bacterium]MCB9821397.1 aminoacyl-tRNA hydrolase [Candidatus Nomurabacteria bacterium]